ncbi:MAG: hypothetical protein PHF84_06320, partial [bacterium]|nr:hypothetical protein [bacterium]
VNIIGNGLYRFQAFMDEKKEWNLELHSGTKSFYNILHAGWNGPLRAASAGFGFGKPFSLSESMSLALEILGSRYFNGKQSMPRQHNLLVSFRLGLQTRMLSFMTLVTGISYNYFTSFNTPGIRMAPEAVHHYEFPWGNRNNIHWPGFYIGLRF